jgi:flagellar protein FliO/FliZ
MEMLGLAGRIVLSLAAVLGLMWLMARASRRKLGVRAGDRVAVLARQQLSRGASVAVVKVGGRALVIGVTDAQVSLLSETELTEFETEPAPAARSAAPASPAVRQSTVDRPLRAAGPLAGSALSPATWRQAVDTLRDRTARN